MEKLKIKQTQKNLSEVEISIFEQDYSLKLPDNFKKFLLKKNGGIVENESSEISLFLSLNEGQSIKDEIDTHQITEQNIPKGFLPIALDYSDNPITINLNEGDDYGKIVIFELDFEGDGHVIANSLEELLGVNNIDEF
jgi:cell wall assembly regulator SMI1